MNRIKKTLNNQGGFTLIEMLIVVAIIAILIAISIPMVNSSLEKARNSTDNANVRAAKAAALLMYTNDTTGAVITGSGGSGKYKASTGEIVAAAGYTAEKYGKSSAATNIIGSTEVPKGKDLTVTVDNTGAVTLKWE